MELLRVLGYFMPFFIQFHIALCKELGYEDLVFVVLSQADPLHEKKALSIESNIRKQTNNMSKIYVTQKHLKHVGDWTVLPLLEMLWNFLEGNFIWIFFCTDQTKIYVDSLINAVHEYSQNEAFIGRGIKDLDPTIIHHFALLPQFRYPLFESGFGLNYKLIKRLLNLTDKAALQKVDFSIDASHELALFLKNNINGTLLINSPYFCLEYEENCATSVEKTKLCKDVDLGKIFFAVKTCKQFHKDRVPVVQETWGRIPQHISYFSDVYDESIPTVKVQVPNVKNGHCTKTAFIFQIMARYMTHNSTLQWIVLSDDDTILSVRRIQKLLGCYDPNKPYVLGERYGYNVYHTSGYNYVTGGGGAVLSRAAIMKFVQSNCTCPSDSAPDDMYLLGICIQRLGITLVHIPLFHQARPSDYSGDYLKIGEPISFHKHWMTDPIQIYKEWFNEIDLLPNKEDTHYEL